MSAVRFWTQRASNSIRKVAAGLRPFGESVWPGVQNDLFAGHASLYLFAGRFVRGARVLDVGCGTGYGAAILASHGALEVLGVDIDPLSVAYANRHFAAAGIHFRTGDAQRLLLSEATIDFLYASNVLEHLEAPELLLENAFQALRPGGAALFAVPPITSEAAATVHRGIHYHRSNLSVVAWHTLLAGFPWNVSVHAHAFAGSGPHPDFGSPFPTALHPSAFVVEPSTIEAIYGSPPITAVFLATKAASRPRHAADLPLAPVNPVVKPRSLE